MERWLLHLEAPDVLLESLTETLVRYSPIHSTFTPINRIPKNIEHNLIRSYKL